MFSTAVSDSDLHMWLCLQQGVQMLKAFMCMLGRFEQITPNQQLRMQLMTASMSFLHHAMTDRGTGVWLENKALQVTGTSLPLILHWKIRT